MEFRNIDCENKGECAALKVKAGQEDFVADNEMSLSEAAENSGLYPLGIYEGETMVGFLLYDYDETYPGWSLSRFMIGADYQGRGLGRRAAEEFLQYFQERHKADRLYLSVSLNNRNARRLYASLGFQELQETEYCFHGKRYREMQMVKELPKR